MPGDGQRRAAPSDNRATAEGMASLRDMRVRPRRTPKPAADPSPWEPPPALAAGLAVLVAALAAVGVSGGALQRAVRNEPGWFILVFTSAVLLATVMAVAFFRRSGRGLPAVVASVVIGALAAFSMVLGAASLDVREKPAVSLSAARTATGGLVVTVNATGSGLRADEDMLVQLRALERFPTTVTDFAGNLPESHGTNWACAASQFQTTPPEAPTVPDVGPLLAWQQAGPDADGAATIEMVVPYDADVPDGFCAAALYREPRENAPGRLLNALQRTLGISTGNEPTYSTALLKTTAP